MGGGTALRLGGGRGGGTIEIGARLLVGGGTMVMEVKAVEVV